MDKDEKTLWDLFCTTGEPRYYSMYVRAKNNGGDGSTGKENND